MLRSKGAEAEVVERLCACKDANPGAATVVEVVVRLACASPPLLPFDGNVLLFMVTPQREGVRFLTDVLEQRAGRAAKLRHLHEEYMGMPDYTCRFLASVQLFKRVDIRVKMDSVQLFHVSWEPEEQLQVLQQWDGQTKEDARARLCQSVDAWARSVLPCKAVFTPARVCDSAIGAEEEQQQQPCVGGSATVAAAAPMSAPKPGDVVYVLGRNRKVYKDGAVMYKGKKIPVEDALQLQQQEPQSAGA